MSHHTDRLEQSLWCFGLPVLWYSISIFTGVWLYRGVSINPAYSLAFFSFLAFIIIVPFWFRYTKRYGLLPLGLFSSHLMLKLAFVLLLILMLTSMMMPSEERWVQQMADFSKQGWLSVVLAMILFSPIIEEIVFRGFLLQGLLTWLPNNRLACCILVSLLFAAAHTQYTSTVTLTELITISLLLCYARLTSKGLLMPILTHMLTNSAVLLFWYVSTV
ncbi:CPBP family intramembrane metalloprotease [Candidatus Symbiopectobacterium sp. NZEC127]|uniref:CPBP family intramembrane glutamic endopeptidase n=1 Tax=Candidatus Symbiopectobacterium sp. NZEC127 TaxID=2820472 RepID=UPI002226EB65|nr:type II CAAX endopeptidase family protein [Candidatus Symbiopectobacterium sp. NZEC127]MCW2484420.1 CPBP family intramembrane metalloprotease [Candidatus Symbiopectobacterium sp. NZEC127]